MHWNPLCDTNKIEILTRDFKIPWSIQMQDFFVILDTYCIIKKIHFFNAIQLSVILVNQKKKRRLCNFKQGRNPHLLTLNHNPNPDLQLSLFNCRHRVVTKSEILIFFYPLTLKIWLLILPSNCYTFPCKFDVIIWCYVKINF